MALNANGLLASLRSGLQCSQPMDHATSIFGDSWMLENGVRVSNDDVQTLRKTGHVAITHGVLFRYLRLIENSTQCRRMECGSGSI